MNLTTDSLVRPNSVREKLAQLMFVRIGSNLPPVRKVEQDADRIAELLSECPLGGLILFNGLHDTSAESLGRLQEISKVPLLISSDIERGTGQQLHGPDLFPHAMAFDALGKDAAATVEEFARLTAIDARAAGVHITFAPVADVNIDPRNPIIATRAFSNDPQRVAELVRAFVRGCSAGGLLSTAKHFPGHGNTHEDSHHELPTVTGDRESLEQAELLPFRAGIEAGVPLIMSAHVRYPAWDDSGAPATLSKPILTDLLRDELGFSGAVVSDSLLMEGVKSQCDGEADLAIRALNAGVDILLDVAEPVETLAAVERAVESGRITEQRVDEAFDRVWALKQSVFVNPPQAFTDALRAQTDELVDRVAQQSIRVIEGEAGQPRFDPRKEVGAVLVRPYQSHLDPPEQPLGGAIPELSANAQYFELGPQSSQNDYSNALNSVAEIKQLLIAIIVKPAAWHAFGLLPEQQQFVEQITNRQPCVLASLGTPEALNRYGNATRKLCTFSDVPASQRALAKLLLSPTD